MKTVLVLAEHPDLAQTLPQALQADEYRVLHRSTLEEAEPLLGGGVIDACIVDVAAGGIQGMWAIEKLRRRMPGVPVLVYVGAKPWEWEEEAYVQGVSFVLTKPVRPRMLNVLLERLWKTTPATAALAIMPRPPQPPTVIRAPMMEPARAVTAPSPLQTLTALRDFSAILTHSLSAEGLLKQFLLLLREIIGVNRAAIFLRSPVASLGDSARGESRRLSCACAIGLSSGMLEHFQLSFESGIGGRLLRSGRILRRYFDEAATDPDVEKEFELLGAQVAVPILDRESLVGVAAFDGRVTGEPLSNSELELIFHLLEELGLAVKNIWQHDQLAENHGLLTNILRELSSACVLVSRDLTILHANKTARSYFGKAGRRSGELEFADLPMVLGSKVFQVLKTGTAIATFRYQPPDQPNVIYQVTIMPFQAQSSGLPTSVLLVVEDQTQSEHLKRLEIEAANLRLVRTMADRLAHEVGNALVPLSTHQQLLSDKFRDPEFRTSLDHALADSVKRISRLINQMRFLAREGAANRESMPLSDLIVEAFQDAQKHQQAKASKLKQEGATEQPIIVAGDHAALRHAFSEVFLNALQANPSDPRIAVKSLMDTDGAGSRWVHIEVEDNGAGFTPEALKKVPEPFYTTRNVGLGLGLTVSRKIIETHHGRLSILPPQEGHMSVVRISLPLPQNAN
jgi:signal transduction histidine kinase/DNA-binding NarL/FixJ family response regulator